MDNNSSKIPTYDISTPKSNPPRLSLEFRRRLKLSKSKISKIPIIESCYTIEDAATRETPSSNSLQPFKIRITRGIFCRIHTEPANTKYSHKSEIYSGRHKIYTARNCFFGFTRVIKEIHTNPEHIIEKTKEFRMCRDLDHPYICNVYEMFYHQNQIEIISEYCEGGEFKRMMKSKNVTELEAARYTYKIALALKYLNNLNISHRDIKPQNIMLTSNNPESSIKLIDFDLCDIIRSDNFHDKVGTLPFAAPDVLAGSFDRTCDIWSLGIIIYMMLRKVYLDKEYPFECSSLRELHDRILNYSPEQLKLAKYTLSGSARDVMLKMLTRQSEQRLSAAQLLEHPWLQQAAPSFPSLEQLNEIRARLIKFKSAPVIQRIIFYYATTQILSYETMREASELFVSTDRDLDSKITTKDLNLCLMANGQQERRIKVSLIKSCSFDKRHYLTYSDFITVILDWNEIMTEGMACIIFMNIANSNKALTKSRLRDFLDDQDIEPIWIEAFKYLRCFPREKVIVI